MRFSDLVRSWRVAAGVVMADFWGGIFARGPVGGALSTVTYSATPTIDATLGNNFVVTVTDNVAFVIAAPLNPPPSGLFQTIQLTIRNASGGAHGAGTWNAVFKTSGNVPAIATGFSRTFGFVWNGTNWVETFRTAADVAN